MKEKVLVGIISHGGEGIQLIMPDNPGDFTDRIQMNQEFMGGTLDGIQQFRRGQYTSLSEVKRLSELRRKTGDQQ